MVTYEVTRDSIISNEFNKDGAFPVWCVPYMYKLSNLFTYPTCSLQLFYLLQNYKQTSLSLKQNRLAVERRKQIQTTETCLLKRVFCFLLVFTYSGIVFKAECNMLCFMFDVMSKMVFLTWICIHNTIHRQHLQTPGLFFSLAFTL